MRSLRKCDLKEYEAFKKIKAMVITWELQEKKKEKLQDKTMTVKKGNEW